MSKLGRGFLRGFDKKDHVQENSPSLDYRYEYRRLKFGFDRLNDYQLWLCSHYPSREVLKTQYVAAAKFKYQPKLSIVLPVYKVPSNLLAECLDSIIEQSYTNWEICIVDDHSQIPELKKLVASYRKKHGSKIKYLYRKTNGHISNSSNDSAGLATGEFLVLLDHDDLLWPNALFRLVQELNLNSSLDFIYTDEDKLEVSGLKDHPYLKPDFNFTMLRSCNYITHLSMVRRSVFNDIGGFRVGVEGAQDWDLFLRIAEHTNAIHHIPDVLYSWRMIESSTALGGFAAKPYALEAQRKAVIDHHTAIGAPVIDALLPEGFVGWLQKFDQNQLNDSINVIIDHSPSLASVHAIINKIEATKGETNITYHIHGHDIRKLISENRSFYKNLSITRSERYDNEIALYLNGISDLEVIPGWLNNSLGQLEYMDRDAIAFRVLKRDHTVVSAGVVRDRKEITHLLEGYVRGFDQRLDTNLLCARDVEFVDSRAFLCHTALLSEIQSDQYNAQRKVSYTPFISCFIESQNTSDKQSETKDYGVAKTSSYWYHDYVIDA